MLPVQLVDSEITVSFEKDDEMVDGVAVNQVNKAVMDVRLQHGLVHEVFHKRIAIRSKDSGSDEFLARFL
jgi:hypothetical protein